LSNLANLRKNKLISRFFGVNWDRAITLAYLREHNNLSELGNDYTFLASFRPMMFRIPIANE